MDSRAEVKVSARIDAASDRTAAARSRSPLRVVGQLRQLGVDVVPGVCVLARLDEPLGTACRARNASRNAGQELLVVRHAARLPPSGRRASPQIRAAPCASGPGSGPAAGRCSRPGSAARR